MALKIVWSFRAKEDINNISIYWNTKNGNSNYSKKIRRLTNGYLLLLVDYPKIGKLTENEFIRFIIIREFKIFYTISNDTIYIVRFWNTRQNPEKLTL